MARIRTVKPAFFKHGDLFEAEHRSGLPLRIAYIGLWTICDREGRFKWRPRDIKPDVLPFDDVSMSDVMDAMVTAGLVVKYAANGQEYGWIPSFLTHQHVNIREPASDIPVPPENKKTRAKRVLVPDAHVGKGREGKGREGDIGAVAPFDEFWKAYPKREARGAAIKAFEKACEKSQPETIVAAAGAYRAKRSGQDKQFTKLPATWLNQECWLDDGVAPAPEPDAVATAEAAAAWDGRAAPLVDDLGPVVFDTWFQGSKFELGPQPRICFPKLSQRKWVAEHFADQLRRHYGEVILEVAA